ncbi:unnamed protein product [Coffea canephora]|uniref:DH200=94 genomic scaffold, scaffold_1489 n=1 Tax=Coffea canephora TaxID=49390 RepID=A0A068VJ63_COFCA|nr:unnamed protein product [Coffea canephora]
MTDSEFHFFYFELFCPFALFTRGKVGLSHLMYLHAYNIMHGDIKLDNLLVTASGTVKIGDFGIKIVFLFDDNGELHHSTGTSIFTTPECYSGSCMTDAENMLNLRLHFWILTKLPGLIYLHLYFSQIVNNLLYIPDGMNPLLKSSIEGHFCKGLSLDY